MHWPEEIVTAFSEAMDVDPVGGNTKDDVIQYLLDETARRAVWRAKADPTRLETAYEAPYTPIGSMIVEGMVNAGKANSIAYDSYKWFDAVQRLYEYVAQNPQFICDHFKDQQVAYHDQV